MSAEVARAGVGRRERIVHSVREARLAIPALGAWAMAGVATGSDAPVAIAVGAVLATLVLSAAVALVRSRVPHRSRLLGALAVAAVTAPLAVLVATAAAVQSGRREPEVLIDVARSSRSVELSVVVSGPGDEGRIPGAAVAVTVGGRIAAIDSPVLIFGRPDADPPPVGSTVSVRGTLRPTDAGDDVSYLVFPRGSPVETRSPPVLLEATAGLRTGFHDAALRLPGDGGALLPGLAIGDTSAVDESLEAAMRVGSLTHLTAVSGANCAVVVAIALGLAGLAGVRRGIRIGIALVLLVGFVLLVTPEPSVLRASVMAALALVAAALGRRARGIPLLSFAVIALLIVDPWLARDYGFVLSVLATGALLTLAGPLAARLARVMPRGIALVLAVPIAAQFVCQPVIVLLDPTLPLYGVPANLLAAPAAPLATVVGLVACLVLPIAPALGGAIAAVAWVPSAWIAAVATLVASLPAARLPWLPGLLGAAALTALSIVGLIAVSSDRARLRMGSVALVMLVAVGYLGAWAGTRIARDIDRPDDWVYALCDVGQGDATVIRSAGAVALVDTGPDPAPLRACLDELGVTRIDLLVLTHYDLDHVGGVSAVLGEVERAIVGPSAGADDDRVVDALVGGGARVSRVTVGEKGSVGELGWRVLWPPPRGVEPGNAASVTLSVRPSPGCTTGCLSALLLGDLGEESQLRMLGSAHPGRYDVVKVAHHGSADQAPRLYSSIRATVGLIGVGADNDYGHPTSSALEMLEGAGTQAFRSDLDGLVLVAAGAEEGEVRVWTERSARSPPADDSARRSAVPFI